MATFNKYSQQSVSRRNILLGATTVLAAGLFPTVSNAVEYATPQTLILDPLTKNWVRYTPELAQKLLNEKGSLPKAFQRQIVEFKSLEKPGTIVINSDRHFLYLVQANQTAIRYGIGVGREGFGWAGVVDVGRTAEWPTWTPPAEMVARDPLAAKWENGMPGGPDNPLGARAIYLYEDGRDTIYRIHGTSEPWSIGLNVSSGCIRMLNDDVIDLYNRIQIGAKVVVLFEDATQFEGVL